MNILLLGAPGSGKGSQSEQILKDFGYVQISTGDLLRDSLSRKTPDGLLAGEYMVKGELVPDDLVIEILRERLNRPDCLKGVIFDGFPRTVIQAEKLDAILEEKGEKLDFVLNIESPFNVLISRLLSRRVCSSCGKTYNMISNPPSGNKCSQCGGEVISRADDREDVIKNRLEVYTQNTLPLVRYFEGKNILISINGDRTVQDIYKDVKRLIEEREKN
ncbi:MAG: adenylate kinase [Candidatus Delongbacteria bacterium]|jgi:adenylate kinase|nr:adenylate kinase [Candidatus Delongbacteria bacterium]MDD4204532.1 adenylate kinase [Candidatus Delongbacteria bacterium]MDY0017470.1 adenylate kinase [Candidatus Delongbacteria bacterium]